MCMIHYIKLHHGIQLENTETNCISVQCAVIAEQFVMADFHYNATKLIGYVLNKM